MANIEKIKETASRLIDLLDGCADYSSQVPLEVYTAFSIKTPEDDGSQSLASILFWSSFELIGATELPGSSIASWFLGGLVDYYSQDGKTPPDLNKKFLSIIERYSETMLQLRRDLGEIMVNPEAHLNDTYKVPFGNKGAVSVAELGDHTVPERRDPNATTMMDVFRKAFRRNIASQLMPDFYRVLVTYYHEIDRPDPFEPEYQLCSESPEDPESACGRHGSNCPNSWNLDHDANNSIILTVPGYHNNNQSYDLRFNNTSVDNSVESFKHTVNSAVKNLAGGCYFSSSRADNKILYYSYWLVSKDCGDNCFYCEESDPPSSSQGWQVAQKSFTDWLFSDDGVGGTIIDDGVATRVDVFMNWGMEGSKGVVKGNL